jgi:DNA-directed RNA polymerase subunit alpha
MLAINEFKVIKLEDNGNSAVFRVDPLPKGYANTLGTVLRRILLSSIPGAAISSVKFAGVQHEYTTIAGLQDDVLNIVLSLKGVAVKSMSETPVTLRLYKKGKKGEAVVVTAGDIEKHALVEIANPDMVITTLADEKAEIDAEITVAQGVGYSLPNEQLREEVGVIPVDAIFSPVTLVAVDAKNTRVGQQTDLDALEIRINTNGTLTPAAALGKAADIMQDMAQHLVGVLADVGAEPRVATASKAKPVKEQKSLEITSLGLSTRLANALVNAGFRDLTDLDGLTEEEVRNLKGMGDKTFTELVEVLGANGIKLV